MVLEKWFCKLVNHFSQTWKKVDLWYKTTLFSGQPLFLNKISRTRFLKPLFYTSLEPWLQNKWSSVLPGSLSNEKIQQFCLIKLILVILIQLILYTQVGKSITHLTMNCYYPCTCQHFANPKWRRQMAFMNYILFA